ncbi:MAG: histidine kinase [Bacteroidaceae bacterium]|nr:histidine kinase [Bacteroidaceae bacterium]
METKKPPRTERMAKPRKRRSDQADMRHERKPLPVVPPVWFFPFRDGMILATCVGLAVIVRTSKAFHEAEEARKEAELGRAEAELKNLRNQINPHFLLNTLNNIYALIQFDAPKAQATVHDLSQLLRFALYDNQKDYVSLSKEIEFEERYVNLMRIRVPKTADISFTHTGEIKQDLQVMPLVYISLIENAFKHGIRTNGEPCFIHIDLTVEHESIIRFCIENSNYPKDDSDRSGSGIGLEQVQKRLDLTYPGRYQWEKGVSADATTYHSHLIIETNPNKTIS